MEDGLRLKYQLAKADGKPVDPDGVYFVLKLNSKDKAHGRACRAGARAYAAEIRETLPLLAADLEGLCSAIDVPPREPPPSGGGGIGGIPLSK